MKATSFFSITFVNYQIYRSAKRIEKQTSEEIKKGSFYCNVEYRHFRFKAKAVEIHR